MPLPKFWDGRRRRRGSPFVVRHSSRARRGKAFFLRRGKAGLGCFAETLFAHEHFCKDSICIRNTFTILTAAAFCNFKLNAL